MSNRIRWRDSHPIKPLLLVACVVMLMAVITAMIFSRGALTDDDAHVVSLRLLKDAYDKVEPGRTSQSDLVALGFDQVRFKARSLSGLGVQEYFMPRTSVAFDQMDPALKTCFDASSRCSALIFPLDAVRATASWPPMPRPASRPALSS
jgi:hypothetical protein